MLAVVATTLAPVGARAQTGGSGPTDPIDYIRSSLEEFPIVVMTEGSHATLAPHLFLRRVVSDLGVLAVADVIMVEFAAGQQQAVLDAYIRGEEVPFDALSRVWRDTGQSPNGPWDSPIYQELLAVIREANLSLPPDQRVRVLAGDPPIDWEGIETREEFQAARLPRDQYAADLAIEQAFGQDKKVLIIFGGAHVPKVAVGPGDGRNPMTYRILSRHPDAVRAIGFLNPENLGIEDRVHELTEGAVYSTASHWVGAMDGGLFFPGLFSPVLNPATGEREMQPVKPFGGHPIRELFDALVYIGSSAEWEFVPPSFDPQRDQVYLDELNRRSMLRFGRPYGSGQ